MSRSATSASGKARFVTRLSPSFAAAGRQSRGGLADDRPPLRRLRRRAENGQPLRTHPGKTAPGSPRPAGTGTWIGRIRVGVSGRWFRTRGAGTVELSAENRSSSVPVVTTSHLSALDATAVEEKSHFRFTRHVCGRQFLGTVPKRTAWALGREEARLTRPQRGRV